MKRRLCEGSGLPAVVGEVPVYPCCSACGREMAAQGYKARRRYVNAWRSVPRHFVPLSEEVPRG